MDACLSVCSAAVKGLFVISVVDGSTVDIGSDSPPEVLLFTSGVALLGSTIFLDPSPSIPSSFSDISLVFSSTDLELGVSPSVCASPP